MEGLEEGRGNNVMFPPDDYDKKPKKELKPFKCLGCDHIFGKTDGRVIIVGDMVITSKTEFRCKRCRRNRVWRKIESPKGT